MKILHIWDGDYPWDIRVEKINDALLENGHEVFLVCRNTARKRLIEEHRNVIICRLPFLPYELGKLNNIYGFPFFFNPSWKGHTLRIAKKTRPKLIFVRDLPLALLAIKTGQVLDIPVILDMAENYPCMFESSLRCSNFNIINYLVRNPKLARLVEKKVLREVDKILVVIEESKERLVSLGTDPAKIMIVRNTPPEYLYLDKHIECPEDDIFHEKDNLIMLYNGLTNPQRGILDFVNNMSSILHFFPNLKLVINGKGKDDRKILDAIHYLGLEKSVFHKGWVSHEDKMKYLQHCDVGLIPYFITSHWNTTIPNKLFDYMAMKKPVISTEIIPTARIINETKCGLIYKRDGINDLCSKIEIVSDKRKRAELGYNGFKAVVTKYKWNIDKQNLLEAVNYFT